MTVTVTSALAGPATARYSNVYGALVDLGVLSGLGAQDVTGSGDPVAPILNASQFYAPLTSSLILTRGTGNPTFTRATSAWEFDNEGKLILVPSGSARFGGARMVRNFAPNSYLSGGGATPTGYSTGVGGGTATPSASTLGYGTAYNITTTANRHYFSANGQSVAVGDVAILSVMVEAAATPIRVDAFFGCVSPANTIEYFDATGASIAASAMVTTGRILAKSTFTAAGPIGFRIGLGLAVSVTGDVTFSHPQLENVTGQADQTASEYVSVGVLSAPYHGAGVDGVKWFNTNKDGSAISASSLLGNHAEGARTNSLLWSRDLRNAAWIKNGVFASKPT